MSAWSSKHQAQGLLPVAPGLRNVPWGEQAPQGQTTGPRPLRAGRELRGSGPRRPRLQVRVPFTAHSPFPSVPQGARNRP